MARLGVLRVDLVVGYGLTQITNVFMPSIVVTQLLTKLQPYVNEAC